MRREESPFEYRGQWLGREPGRDSWYRCWYNDGGRKVSRRSLRTASLDAAKERLIEILSGVPTKEDAKQSPRDVLVSDVLNHYVDHKYPPGRRAAQLVLTGLKTTVAYPKVTDLTLTNQRRIWSHMHEVEGLKAKSISTYMIALRAAINYSARPQIVEIEGKAEEVQLLTETVPVICNEVEIADYLGAEVSEARQFLPSYEQVAKWIDAVEEEADFRYVMIALNTWARNSAIFELRMNGQVDFEYGLVNLNPKGRRQTKKRRPVIRLTSNLRGWLRYWDENRPIKQYQDTVEKRLNAMGAKIGMPDFVCYTLRHFMATQSRRTGVDVTREMRSKWLGHSVSEGSATTAWYEQFDPDFLEPVANATDEIIAGISAHTKKRRLSAPTQHPQSGLQVIAGGKEN